MKEARKNNANRISDHIGEATAMIDMATNRHRLKLFALDIWK